MADALQAALDLAREAVDTALQAAMADLPPGDLTDAMRYASQGGKGLRGFLVLESARLHGVPEASAVPVAAAIEALHAYSLVHDDLPAMDDDDLRRGLPTVHVEWNEALAVLTGDALQTLAFGLLTDPVIGDAEARLRLVRALSDAAGAGGMCLGQALDIAAEDADEPLGLAAIKHLQQAKTGMLFGFAATAGPLITGDDPARLADYARNLGLAFQIADDVLDAVGDEELTGKRTGKDDIAGKATFVSLLGLDGARDQARGYSHAAAAALESYGDEAQNLRALARFVIDRET